MAGAVGGGADLQSVRECLVGVSFWCERIIVSSCCGIRPFLEGVMGRLREIGDAVNVLGDRKNSPR
jgi:hypothetical protein